MTREEAIEQLQNCKDLIKQNGQDYLDERDVPLLDMAIEALSAPSGDVISRADAIETIMSEPMNEPKYPIWFADKLKELPSAEQVISKLNNPCDSLLTDESNGSKEHKSKLDLISRVDAIDALSRSSVYAWSIEQDQTAHNWALNIIKALPSADAIHNGGVFVPNMEMPKACDYCLFHDSGWSWCKAKDKYCGDGKCPLIAVRGERREP